DGRRGRELGPVHVNLPVREPSEQLLECDPALESSQGCADAEVRAVDEREVVAEPAPDVETVAVGEAAVVTVRGPGAEAHGAAVRDAAAVQLDVTRCASRDVRCGRLVPEDLLDRV